MLYNKKLLREGFVMQEFNQLLTVNKHILKVEQLKEKENKESYNLVLEDLYEKEQTLLTFFRKNYNTLNDLVTKTEENLGFDLKKFSLINLIEHTSLPIYILSTLNSLQNIWEFASFQAFSALNFDEALSVKDMPYFKNYLEAFLEFKNWEYSVAQTFLEMIDSCATTKESLEYFLQNNIFQKMAYSHDSEKALEFKLDVLKQLYQEVVRYDIQHEKHEELKILFEACLKNIPEKNLTDVYNELQESFYKLDLADVYPDYFHQLNTLLTKYKIGILEEASEDEPEMEIDRIERLSYIQNGFIMDTRYSYQDILLYNQKFLELEKIGLQILHIYQKLMNCKLHNEKIEYKNFYQKILKELIEKESNLYKNIDLVEFQNYLKVFYTPEIDYFPFGIIDMLSAENSEKERELVFHRIINYEKKDSIIPLEKMESDGYIQLLDIQNEMNTFNIESLKKMFFLFIQLYLGNISKEDFFKEQQNFGFDYDKEWELLEEEQIASLWQFIEKNYLNILLQNGEQELVWYYLFFRNQEMEYLVQKDFNCSLTIDYSCNPAFYPFLRDMLYQELCELKKEAFQSENERKQKFFEYYLESCLIFLKEKDKEKFKKICEKGVNRKRKK